MSAPKSIDDLHRDSWVHCIAAQPGGVGTTLCGLARWSHHWCFVDAKHAVEAVRDGSRLVPCGDCWAAAEREAFRLAIEEQLAGVIMPGTVKVGPDGTWTAVALGTLHVVRFEGTIKT